MSTDKPPGGPAGKLLKAVPYAWIHDLEEATKYYTEILGFVGGYSAEWEDKGRKGGIVGVFRDGLELQLATCFCEDRRHDGLGYFIAYTDDAKAVHDDLRARGASVLFEYCEMDWGGKSFTIEDPWGNRIEFLQMP